MTLAELNKARRTHPYYIFLFCTIPYCWAKAKTLEEYKLVYTTVGPVVALLLSYFYINWKFRRNLWVEEKDTFVGDQIRKTLLEMVPDDLQITDDEKNRLSKEEIYRELTGVFWEAIDRSDRLRALKDHFYSNGIGYSTSLDVSIICWLAAVAYALASLPTRSAEFVWGSAVLMAISIASWLFVTPGRRARHLALSAEQLDLLRREQIEFVRTRFREIITAWRAKKAK